MAKPVTLTTLARGYRYAFTRWMSGPRVSTDADEAFFGIFEALNWAVVVDNRLADVRGRGWASVYGKQDLIAGFRYARNSVHHDWADALELMEGAVLPTPVPFGLFEWLWRSDLHAKRQGGKTQYRVLLAEKPVRFTLESLDHLYASAVR